MGLLDSEVSLVTTTRSHRYLHICIFPSYCSGEEVKETEDVKLRNASSLNGIFDSDNLIDLLFLNEPEVLRCLKLRFFKNKIYTYTGTILIAINPFKVS